ncbi:MAG: SUF system NifU family Fe-S cluster assembly protein [Dehalococcoidia bacterium]|nr:SUF system NifU family Fe-S cluster assembly protein [Dehalococcoidia bacterium]
MSTQDVELDDLYREIILDHYRKPRNKGRLEHAEMSAEGLNPVCGDEIRLELRLGLDGRIAEIAFGGRGCSISQASASMLTEDVKGKTFAEARGRIDQFRAMMTEGSAPPQDDSGDIESLQGVAKFPARVKCAMLSWNVLQQAMSEGAASAPGKDDGNE